VSGGSSLRGMGIWGEQVVPRLAARLLDNGTARQVRAAACDGLTGEVLEIGFGSGLNVPHYPAEVTRVTAVEPSDVGWRLAQERIGAASVPVQRSGLDGQSLPFPDESFDSALSTWTLCTIPDALAALREVRRVLRPGAVLHVAEHGRAPDEGVHRWQRRLDPVQKRLGGGCHLSKPIDELLTAAGFTVERLEQRYLDKEPRVFGSMYEGRARA
jgi:ubiquinone/menaquinone biosynthesis C-methylase UbiE